MRLDAHASSCTLGVVGPSRKRLGLAVIGPDARATWLQITITPSTGTGA